MLEKTRGLARTTGRAVSEFNPEKSKETISALKAAIKHAKEMQDWKSGWKAVDWLIEEQKDFIAWWQASVQKGGGGKAKELQRRTALKISQADAEKKTKIKHQQVSRWQSQINRPTYRAMCFKPSYTKAMADRSDTRSELQTGEMEWFTPSIYIEKARRVLGTIDLDPASCAPAQKTVKATKFYTHKDDGLTKIWKGKVWLNPPYAGGLVAAFAQKMVESWNSGELTCAIMLTNSYTETSWFHELAKSSHAICFTRGRIKFESPYGEKCAPTNGQSFFYFGEDVALFKKEFNDVGLIMEKV